MNIIFAMAGSDVRCVTDGGFEVLFDPASVAAPLAEDWWERRDRQLADGTMAFREFGDGAPTFRVFVGDETPPRSLSARVSGRATGRLHLPSGQLSIVSMENVGAPLAPSLSVEPGWYDVTLEELDLGGVVEWLGDRAARRASPGGARANERLGLMTALTLAGLLFAVLLTTLFIWEDGWTGWSRMWPVLLGGVGLLAVLASVWRATPGTAAAARARSEVVESFPTTLVRLTRATGPGPGCVLTDASVVTSGAQQPQG